VSFFEQGEEKEDEEEEEEEEEEDEEEEEEDEDQADTLAGRRGCGLEVVERLVLLRSDKGDSVENPPEETARLLCCSTCFSSCFGASRAKDRAMKLVSSVWSII